MSKSRRAFLKSKQLPGWLPLWECARCGKQCQRKHCHIDHITPAMPIKGFDSYDAYIDRLFYGELQMLCLDCHTVKTNKENSKRKVFALHGHK